ncbi:hypothetical protein AAFF_G00085120 [Aldrovandia affinis]|uniref:Uncharacterized protein n=1 Tax=Aldrovandia affinis TaxID=143900 RepID=A0AAD7R220_9TELE|nr:hypothetical protein AAFF_G00085120 [Aldrovandia affinis]
MSTEEVSAVMDAHRTGGVSQLLCTSPELLQLPEEDPSIVIPHSQLHNVQQQDAVVSRVLFYVQRHRRPNARERAAESSCVLRLLKHWKKLKVRNGLLYRVKRDRRMDRKIYQFVTPEALKRQVLHGVHDAVTRAAQEHFLWPAKRFFWTGMQRDVVNHLALAFPCRNQSAKQVARCLWDKFFCIYGFPKESIRIKELILKVGFLKIYWRWQACKIPYDSLPPHG